MSTDPEPGSLRCPICFAPLVLQRGKWGTKGYVCSRFPLGFMCSTLTPAGHPLRPGAADAGYCEPNGPDAAWHRRFTSLRTFCFHVSSGQFGWYIDFGEPLLVPVKDSLVDLVTDTLADT